MNGEFDKAIEWEYKNQQYMNNYLHYNNEYYGYSYLNIGEAFFYKNECDKALHYTQMGYDILVKDSLDVRRALTNLVELNIALDNKAYAENFLLELNRINIKRMKTLFTELTYQEKQGFLRNDINYFTRLLPKYTYKLNSDTLKSALYNGVLLSKGALLNSDINFRNIIKNSNTLTINITTFPTKIRIIGGKTTSAYYHFLC